ncbi:LysM peptidoglycan-binding domain-containing protein [Planktotalea lamellibrachiae]|nr:LysM peptidoglycan-binding domain-containing protein [Aliiroseovarius lamellibrachiae]
MSLLVDGKAVQSSEQSVIVGPTKAPRPEADATSVTAALDAPVPGGDTGDTVPEVAAEAPVEQPQSPQVLLADQEGIVVIQDAGENGEPVDVSLDSISYDETGVVALAGRGTATQTIHIYLDNARIAEGRISENGQWRVMLNDVDAGIYTMRIEALDGAENVTSQLETPFKREDPAQLAALSEAPADVQTEDVNEGKDALAAPKEPAIHEAKTPSSDGANGTTTNSLEVAVANGSDGQETPVTPPATQEDAEVALTQDALPDPARGPSADAQLNAEQDEGDVAVEAANATGETTSRPRVVTVQAGATLWAIARDNLGEGTLYVQVFDANRDKISNPDLIYPGQVFAVPGQQ